MPTCRGVEVRLWLGSKDDPIVSQLDRAAAHGGRIHTDETRNLATPLATPGYKVDPALGSAAPGI